MVKTQLQSGLEVRPFSAGLMTIGRKIGLRCFDAADREGMTPAELELEMYAVGWLMCAPLVEVRKAESLTWPEFCAQVLEPWLGIAEPVPAYGVLAAADIPTIMREFSGMAARMD